MANFKLLSSMGYDTLFFTRIDTNEKEYRKKNKLLEFIQKTNDSEIFTHIFSNHYNGPSFISYGRNSYQGEIIVNNPSSPYYNVEQVGNRFY